MSYSDIAAFLTATATAILAYFTWKLARATKDLVLDAHSASAKQLELEKKQNHLKVLTDMSNLYESARLRSARYRYVIMLLDHRVRTNDRFQDEVLNFFDLGLLLKNDYLEPKMVWSMFSDEINYWWSAAERDIIQARKEDPAYYENFSYLVQKMNEIKIENLTSKDIEEFLREQKETLGNMPSWHN